MIRRPMLMGTVKATRDPMRLRYGIVKLLSPPVSRLPNVIIQKGIITEGEKQNHLKHYIPADYRKR